MSEAASPEEEVTFGDKIKAAKEGDKDTQGLLYKNMDFASVQIGCLQVAPVQIIGSTSVVLSQIHNLLDDHLYLPNRS